MIIWKGFGIVIPVLVFVGLWLARYLVSDDLKITKLRWAIGLLIAGGLLLLTIWKRNRNDRKIEQMEDGEKKEKYKKAMAANPMMDFDNSSLFFIPILYWPYILFAGGLTYLILHFIH